ncbi:MAG TPA: conjugal transfer protein TraH [Syntrophorhabdaceae bacterium]|jgi:conjugative transfer pilus assembly protein TraH|nr:conjugal transfer protein TraH [Syntrophorhabdaceae bacterium]HQM82227.1 conjugal transfer protein TraH [Syntrophorhabdaceae bacterium]
MELRKICAIILLLALLVTPATANLNDSLNDMFTRWGGRVNVTDPGAYTAQTRGFLVGGSLSARVPSTSLQPFTWKEPFIKAGCGGIDIFGGSFSFINAEQFTQFLQAIGQNALGYAFSLGLEAVCPTCNATIKQLRQYMNDLNKYGMDSCMAAKSLVNTAGDALNLWDMKSCEADKGAIANGGYDHVAGYLTCAAGSESEVRQQLRNNSLLRSTNYNQEKRKGAPKDSTTHQALKQFQLTAAERQEIMSLIGTWYTRSEEGSTCQHARPTLTLAELVEGGTVKLLKCGTGGFGDSDICQDVTTEDSSLDGYAKRASDMMKAIYEKIRKDPEEALTDDERTFINAVPIPAIGTMLRSVSKESPDIAKALIDLTSELVGATLAWHHIQNFLEIYEGGTMNITACGMKEQDVREQIKVIKASRQELFDKYMQGFQTQVATIKFQASINAAIATKSKAVQKAINYRIGQ